MSNNEIEIEVCTGCWEKLYGRSCSGCGRDTAVHGRAYVSHTRGCEIHSGGHCTCVLLPAADTPHPVTTAMAPQEDHWFSKIEVR